MWIIEFSVPGITIHFLNYTTIHITQRKSANECESILSDDFASTWKIIKVILLPSECVRIVYWQLQIASGSLRCLSTLIHKVSFIRNSFFLMFCFCYLSIIFLHYVLKKISLKEHFHLQSTWTLLVCILDERALFVTIGK